MEMIATVTNIAGKSHRVAVVTNGNTKTIGIPAKADGPGSAVNGGELLFTALATCFCNDVYREAMKRKMTIASVEVKVTGSFGGEGDPASDIRYSAHVEAPAHTRSEISDLIIFVDNVAEIHNTLRKGLPVRLEI